MQAQLTTLMLSMVLATVGCRRGGELVPLTGELHVEPAEALVFPDTPLGGRTVRLVRLENRGSARLDLEVAAEGPFSVTSIDGLLPGQLRTVEVAFSPMDLGPQSGRLRITGGASEAVLLLSGTAVAACARGTCERVEVEPDTGRCIAVASEDGAPCEDACLEEATCLGGQCVGRSRSCDDGNVCTRDACNPGEGCLHEAINDETPCGRQDCSGAQFCMSGACVERILPDGASCGGASPCQPQGACQAGECHRPSPEALRPVWTWTAPLESAQLHLTRQLIVDREGSIFSVAVGPSQSRVFSLDREGLLRFMEPLDQPSMSLLEGTSLIVFTGNERSVEALDAQTGNRKWEVSFEDAYFAAGEVRPPAESFILGINRPLVSAREGELSFSLTEHRTGECVGLRLITLSAHSGTVLERHAVASACPSLLPVADGTGRILWGTREGGTLVLSVPGSGLRWIPAPEIILPLAWRAEGLLATVRDHDQGTDVLAGYMAQSGARSFVANFAPFFNGVITGGGSTLAVGSENSGSFRKVIARISHTTGAISWSRRFPDWGTGPFLTDRGSVLYAEQYAGSDDPLTTSTWLTELGVDGGVRWSCRVPDGAILGGLHEGRVYMGMPAAMTPDALMAFDIPGLRLAPHGWVMAAGEPQRRWRPR